MQTVAWVGAGTAGFGLFIFDRIQNECVTHSFDLFNWSVYYNICSRPHSFVFN